MFSICDIEDRQFRDTLANLRKVQETEAGLGMEFHKNLAEVLA